MSYIAKQKIKGNIYLYRVDSYWDKENKQSRQKRTYIGPENKKKCPKKLNNIEIVYKKYGNMFLLNTIISNLGLRKILSECFPDDYNEVIALAVYSICSGSPMYLFPQWFHEHCNIKSRSLHSREISSLCEKAGSNQIAIRNFFSSWISKTGTDSDIYYDITSIPSYSDNIDFIEWGYNRDHENLPQTNLGIACNKNSIPLFYQLYPGSITDVTTLKKSLTQLEYYDFSNAVLILDRGFCSRLNIMEMNALSDKIQFIQPMTYSMKKVVELLKANRKKLRQTETAFKYNEEILHYIEDTLDIEGVKYRAHLFYNEKAEADLRNNFMHKILSIKEKILSA